MQILVKATADRPRNMAPHGQVGLQQDAEIAYRGRGPYQGPTDTQHSCVNVDTPTAGRTPQEERLLGVKPQSAYTCQHPVLHHLFSSSFCPLPLRYFRMDYQIIVISEMLHGTSANAAKGSSL